MATASVIDPDWKLQVDQATRVLEKYGATGIVIYRHTPSYPQGYIVGYRFNDSLWEAAGETLPRLVESIVRKLQDAAANIK